MLGKPFNDLRRPRGRLRDVGGILFTVEQILQGTRGIKLLPRTLP